MLTFNEFSILESRAKIKKVVRKGKIVKILKCKPGFKLKNGSCVRVSTKDRMKKRRAAIKAARKRKAKKAASNRRRKLSLKRRKTFAR